MSVIQKLTAVFREVFEDEEIEITTDTTADDIEAWDSLSHMNLILTVEKRFNIKFLDRELITFKNVGDLIKSIENKVD